MGLLQLSLTQLSPSSLHCPSEILSNNSRSHWTEAVGLKIVILNSIWWSSCWLHLQDCSSRFKIKIDFAIISN